MYSVFVEWSRALFGLYHKLIVFVAEFIGNRQISVRLSHSLIVSKLMVTCLLQCRKVFSSASIFFINSIVTTMLH